MAGNVLITGASGLLGRELVSLLFRRGFGVTAQYHSNHPVNLPGDWIPGDLSTLETTRIFLKRHRAALRRCTHFIHGYGPIHLKTLDSLKPVDFMRDYHGNVAAFHAVSSALIRWGSLESALAVGFADAGKVRTYRLILTHAAAKNALLLLVLSLARENPRIRFTMVSPSTLRGARFSAPEEKPLEVDRTAEVVADTLMGTASGIHMVVTPEHPLGEVVYAI